MRRLALCFTVLGSLVTACSTSSEDTSGDDSALNRAAQCSAQQSFDAFQKMIKAPIKPPRLIAGVDLAGPTWSMATLDDVEAVLCQGNPIGEDVDHGELTMGWGVAPNYQVVLTADKTTRKVGSFQLNPGYQGTLDFESRKTSLTDPSKPNPFGRHKYSVGVGRQVLRDGQPWQLNWGKTDCSQGDCWDRQATEMFDAMMYTFAPELQSTQGSCIAEALCLAKAFATKDAVFGVRPLGMYFYVPDITQGPAVASTPGYFYGFTFKNMAFSSAEMFMKLDAEGPVAQAKEIGTHRKTCTIKLGTQFQSFLGDCVQIVDDAAQNEALKKKLLGGASRVITTSASGDPTGTWILDVAGVNPNFDSERFDEREPSATARATELSFDIRSSGKVLNDYSADGKTFTFAGTGAVYREYARLVQDMLNATGWTGNFALGAEECLLPAGADATTWRPTAGCTGMESFVTPAEPSTTSDLGVKRMSVGAKGTRLGFKTILKPGDPIGAFCIDPAPNPEGKDVGPDGKQALCVQDSECRSLSCEESVAEGVKRCADPMRRFYRHCFEAEGGLTESLFTATHKQIVKVLGGGRVESLPPEAQDPKVYVKLYAKALVKYLSVAANRPADISGPEYDQLTPPDAAINVEVVANDRLKVTYGRKLEINLLMTSGNVQEITFR